MSEADLVAEIKRQVDLRVMEGDAFTGEIRRLQEALAPFSHIALSMPHDADPTEMLRLTDTHNISHAIERECFFRARRAALRSEEKE